MALLMKNSFEPKFSQMISQSNVKVRFLFVVELEKDRGAPEPEIIRGAPFGEIFRSNIRKPLKVDCRARHRKWYLPCPTTIW